MAKTNPQTEARDVKTLVKAFFAAADRVAAEYRATIIKAGLAQIAAEIKLLREKMAADTQAAKIAAPAKAATRPAKAKKAVTAKKTRAPADVTKAPDADAEKAIAAVTKVRAAARERKARTNGAAAPHESAAA